MSKYPSSEYWICKNGTKIRYQDMTDEHLNKVVNFVGEKMANFINRCMSRNEELEPPQWIQDVITALDNEQKRRQKNGNK